MQFSDAPTSSIQHLFRGGYLLQLLRVESLVAGAEMFFRPRHHDTVVVIIVIAILNQPRRV